MSAKLVYRAAAMLRERVDRLPGAMGDRPWRLVLTDSESLDGVAACAEHEGASETACDGCWPVTTPREAVAAYIFRMHPPVALALADVLERVAAFAEAHNDAQPQEPVLALARAILREAKP